MARPSASCKRFCVAVANTNSVVGWLQCLLSCPPSHRRVWGLGTGNTCAPIAGRQEGPNRGCKHVRSGSKGPSHHLAFGGERETPNRQKTVHSRVGTRVSNILTLPRWPPASVHAPPVACGTVTMVRCVATTAQLRLDSIVKLWFTNLVSWTGSLLL